MKNLICLSEKRKRRRHGNSGAAGAFSKKSIPEAGFSLIEVIFAMVILLIALLGVFVTFTYSVNYNAGNSSRSEALAILQQEVEQIRSKKFTPDYTDPALYGGVKPEKIITALNGNKFKVAITVDNNPLTPNIIETDESVNPPLKQISVTVTLDRPTPGWQTAVPATVVLQRVRGN
jgi:prepilin-type N-terminal cleavage/methylation domain-containing protein